MAKQLQLINCNVTAEHLMCQPCHKQSAGGFHPDYGILLCQDGFFNKKHMEDTVVHEMVHMYDHAKFQIDWNNLRHHACSEASFTLFSKGHVFTGLQSFFFFFLSRFERPTSVAIVRSEESLTGAVGPVSQHSTWYDSIAHQHAFSITPFLTKPVSQDCVRMRAVTSVASNPVCPSQEAAEQAVDEVWNSCIKDTRPFDEVSSFPSSSPVSCQSWRLTDDCRYIRRWMGPPCFFVLCYFVCLRCGNLFHLLSIFSSYILSIPLLLRSGRLATAPAGRSIASGAHARTHARTHCFATLMSH